ncbi:hypothetical protein EXN66_Car009944 [Channa argus]|uniref:Uncharacterized protein n=1 Tax=Channa argus TaxID=215402 RepID=A0A6G1PWA8_CHAAH|nr:hypothetical protein EXN66_Car009944 [Channa argus]
MGGLMCVTGGLDRGLFLHIEGRNAGGRVTQRLSYTNWAVAVGDTGWRLRPPHASSYRAAFFRPALKCSSF